MKKTHNKVQTHETALPGELISSWESSIIESARIRGTSRDASHKEKLAAIVRAERSNVKSLWEAFTTDRQNLPRYLLDPKKQTASYLLGFHLPNCARAWNLLNRFDRRHGLSKEANNYSGINIFDLGCGTGAVGQSLVSFLKHKKVKAPIDVSLVDTQGPFLDATRLGFKNMGFEGQIRSKKARLEGCFDMVASQLKKDKLNIVVLGYVWNELQNNPKAQRKFHEFAMEASLYPTMFLVLEPANQHLARSAMELRDDMVMAGYKSLYPCIMSKPCPMLEKPKDWCYSETTWKLPKTISDLDRYLDLNRSKLKYAGYVLSSEMLAEKLAEIPEGEYTVVGRPTMQDKHTKKFDYKKDFEYLICKGESLAKAPSNAAPKLLSRGTLLFDKKKPKKS